MTATPAVGPAHSTDLEHSGPITMTFKDRRLWIVSGLLLLVAVIAQTIGEVDIPLGGTVSITLLPMIWAILIGGFVSGGSGGTGSIAHGMLHWGFVTALI